MKQPKHAPLVSQGVEALIQRLQEEGVEAGRLRAEEERAAAVAEAARIRADAKAEAEALRAAAGRDAAALRAAGEEALAAAARTAILRLRQDLLDRFSADVRRLVSTAMADPDLTRAMILEVAAGAREAAGLRGGEPMTALLADENAYEELRQDTEALRAAPATQLVCAAVGHALSEGVTLGGDPADAGQAGGGVLLRLRGGDLEIDLSDGAVASVILAHLQPRFRALFDGIIR